MDQHGIPVLKTRNTRHRSCLYGWTTVVVVAYVLLGLVPAVRGSLPDLPVDVVEHTPGESYTLQSVQPCRLMHSCAPTEAPRHAAEHPRFLGRYTVPVCYGTKDYDQTLLSCWHQNATLSSVVSVPYTETDTDRHFVVQILSHSCISATVRAYRWHAMKPGEFMAVITGSGHAVLAFSPESKDTEQTVTLDTTGYRNLTVTTWSTGGHTVVPTQYTVELPSSSCFPSLLEQLDGAVYKSLTTSELCWAAIFCLFLLKLLFVKPDTWPTLSCIMTSLLLSTSIPLMHDMGLARFLISSMTVWVIPITIAVVYIIILFQRSKYSFVLPSRDAATGCKGLSAYFFVQFAVSAAAYALDHPDQ